MPDTQIPYMNGHGHLSEILKKIIDAPVPPKFTYDYLSGTLGIKSSSARPGISILKKMNFLQDDATPTERYKQYRNAYTRNQALADGIKEAFSDIYSKHEYAHTLSKEEIKELVVELTGDAKNSKKVGAIVGTFCNLVDQTSFDEVEEKIPNESVDTPQAYSQSISSIPNEHKQQEKIGMALSYTINLNLPETTNSEVYNAIFKSLKENLL